MGIGHETIPLHVDSQLLMEGKRFPRQRILGGDAERSQVARAGRIKQGVLRQQLEQHLTEEPTSHMAMPVSSCQSP